MKLSHSFSNVINNLSNSLSFSPVNNENYQVFFVTFGIPFFFIQKLYFYLIIQKFNINTNIDGAVYKEGKSAFSFYGLPKEIEENAKGVINQFNGMVEGVQWPQ